MDWTEITKWGGWIGMTATTILYFLFPARKKQLDEATAKLVETLQETVDAMELRIKEKEENEKAQDQQIEELQKHQKENISKITAIEAERNTLLSILQGRDSDTARFYQEGFESMKRTKEMSELMKGMSEAMTELARGVNAFIKTFNHSVNS